MKKEGTDSFWSVASNNLSMEWDGWGAGCTLIGCGHIIVGFVLLWFRNTWLGDVIGSPDFWTKVAVFAFVAGGIWVSIFIVGGGIIPAQKEVYPTKGQIEQEKEEAQRKKNEQISRYKKTLPGLYNNLSKQQLSEARDCILSIMQTKQTYGNPTATRLVEIVNKFWIDPVMGVEVSLPHDLSFFNYDLEYIDSILQ